MLLGTAGCFDSVVLNGFLVWNFQRSDSLVLVVVLIRLGVLEYLKLQALLSGCGVDASGGLEWLAKDGEVTCCCGGEVGATGTGEGWEETGDIGNVGVGKILVMG